MNVWPHLAVIIDLGLVKEKRFDATRGMETLTVVPISQSAAVQRTSKLWPEPVVLAGRCVRIPTD